MISSEEQKLIIEELNKCVMECVDDQNANHVIQKCIETIPHQHIDFIIQHFLLDVLYIYIYIYSHMPCAYMPTDAE